MTGFMTSLYEPIFPGYTTMSGFHPHLNNHLVMASPSLPPTPVRAPPPPHDFIGPGSGPPQITERPQQPRRKHSRHETTLARGSKKAPTRLLLPREPVIDERQAGSRVDGDGDASGVTNGAAESPDEKPKITTVACQECQRKKCKCDGARPSCRACTRKGVQNCVYQDREDTTRKLRQTNKQLKDDNQLLQDENSSLRKELEELKVRTNSMSSEQDRKETTRTDLSNSLPPRGIDLGDPTTMYSKTAECHRHEHNYTPIRGSNDTWLPSMTDDHLLSGDNQSGKGTAITPNLAGAAAAAVRLTSNPSPATVKSSRSASTSKPKKRSFEECSSASDSQTRDHTQQQPSPVNGPNKPANTSKPRKRTTSRDAGPSDTAVQSLTDQQPLHWLKGHGPTFTQWQAHYRQQPPQQYPFPTQPHGPLFEHAASPQTIYPAPNNQDLFQQYRSAPSSFSLPTPAYTHHAQPQHPTSSTLNPSMIHQHQLQSQQHNQASDPVSPIPGLPHLHNSVEYKHHHRPTASPSVSSHPSAVSLSSFSTSASASTSGAKDGEPQWNAKHTGGGSGVLPEPTIPRQHQRLQAHEHGLLNGNHGLDMNALPGAFDVDGGMGMVMSMQPGMGMGMGMGMGIGSAMGMGGYAGLGMHGYGEGGGFPGNA